jgi:hypothetical protein
VEVRVSGELRDRFFVLSAGAAPAQEVERYRAEVDATQAEAVATMDGLEVCWHPTARFKTVRFVDAELIDASVRESFARPCAQAPYLAAVFVDPREFSFRTFENIVPLDRLFEDIAVEAELTGRTEPAQGVFTFSLDLPEPVRERVARLDELGLYVPPLNATSRGGQRYIFHSALLAEALSAALAEALPAALAEGFSHVNPVFRCNRFEPGDAKFHQHRDAPYFDRVRRHISRYTLLIYLTGGTGAPTLDVVGATALERVEAFTCVLFDQQFEHEGAAYLDGRKVFLRTELIYVAEDLAEEPEIGALFSKACYLTGESVFAPELARHADAYYNQVAAAHWNGLGRGPARQTFVHKEFRGVHFVANGYDFWFAASQALSLQECAALTLLDYFNCRLGDTPFRSQCRTEVIEAEDGDWIPEFLRARPGGPVASRIDKSLLFPEPERACDDYTDAFDMMRDEDVVDIYTEAQDFAKAHILHAPILMLGQEIALDPDCFVVEGTRIHVLGREPLRPVNFASADVVGPHPDCIDTAATVGAAQLLVPPILYSETAGCRHLGFDFFRNSWMVEHRQVAVPIPRIAQMEDDLYYEDMWSGSVDRSLVDADHPLSDWWFEDLDEDEEEE